MKIAITGSIATGKSVVTNYLINKGYSVIDCDEISHYVIEFEAIKNQIINYFSDEVLDKEQNKIDRKALAKIVFSSAIKKKKLEYIIIPQIVKEMLKQMEQVEGEFVFVDAPTLFEASLQNYFDKIVVVYCDKKTQINRLIKRDNITREYALKKISSQWPIERKIRYASVVIDNSKDLQNTYKQIDKMLETFRENKQ